MSTNRILRRVASVGFWRERSGILSILLVDISPGRFELPWLSLQVGALGRLIARVGSGGCRVDALGRSNVDPAGLFAFGRFLQWQAGRRTVAGLVVEDDLD